MLVYLGPWLTKETWLTSRSGWQGGRTYLIFVIFDTLKHYMWACKRYAKKCINLLQNNQIGHNFTKATLEVHLWSGYVSLGLDIMAPGRFCVWIQTLYPSLRFRLPLLENLLRLRRPKMLFFFAKKDDLQKSLWKENVFWVLLTSHGRRWRVWKWQTNQPKESTRDQFDIKLES